MNRTAVIPVLLVMLVVTGMTAPAMAFASNPAPQSGSSVPGSAATMAAQENSTQNDSNVSVSVGQQLATVIEVSSDDIQTEFEDTAFELSVEGADDESQAEAIAERADELRDRAEAIREDYEEATEAYEAGEISKSQYAQRIASLNARANNLLTSYDQLSQRAQNVSRLELRAAGANLSSLDAALENLSSVTGPGSSALLAQYLGEADGEIELETADGIKIEIEREDGASSREFERARDDDMNISVSHADALQTARGALSQPASGHWVLTESKIKRLEGAFEFEFTLAGSSNLTGEAEVRVDGSTGEIYRLEQETERRGEDADEESEEREADEDDHEEEDNDPDELTLIIVEGTPEPNATITLQILADGEPADNATVYLNDHAVGSTGSNGTVVVTLPEHGEAELEAEAGDAEGSLEFEFDDEDAGESVFEHLNVGASVDGDTVTVSVRYEGEPVRNATVYANGEWAGVTDADGVVTFALDVNATEELELEVVKGQFEAEVAYQLQDGSLVLTEEEHEADDEEDEADERDDREEDDDDREDEGEEERDGDDDDEPDDAEDRSLSMAVIHGTPEPGATITVQVTADGSPVEGVTVTMEGDVVGTTDANGTIAVTLPNEDSIDLRAEHGDSEARLEFDFDDDELEETETDDES